MTAESTGADILAGTLFDSLKANTAFHVTPVDLSKHEFQVPPSLGNPLYAPVAPLTQASLTTGSVNGSGMFDGLMKSIAALLKVEYDKGRITGKEYADSWVSAISAAMSASVQYLLQKEGAHYQAMLVQLQARMAEVQSVAENVNLEITKNKLLSSQMEAHTAASTYALSKLKLATEDAQYGQIAAQTEQVAYQTANLMPAQLAQAIKETERLAYEVSHLMPLEKTKSEKQVEAAIAEIAATSAKTNQIVYETSNILPAQKGGLEADTAIKNFQLTDQLPTEVAQVEKQIEKLTYELTYLLPQELLKSEKAVEAVTAEIASTSAKTQQISYETQNMLPAQLAGVVADTANKTYTTTQILPAQKEQIVAGTEKIEYEVSHLLPKELEKATKAVEAVAAEIASISAKKDQILYETASILPAQKIGIEKETAIKTYQLSDRLPAEVAGLNADTAGKLYNNSYLLPAQLASIREQTEGHRAKTLDTRTDGLQVAGAIGKQISLQDEQISSYKRDAETKVVKMLLDTWVTQKSMDEDFPAPSAVGETNINTALAKIRANLNL